MARSIALPDQNCSRSVEPLGAADRAKLKSPADTICPPVSSFTLSARFGAAVPVAQGQFSQTAIATRCSSPSRTESRRLRFPRSVAEPIVIRFRKQLLLLL